MLSEWGWSRPQTLQGFSPLRAMIANLEIHRPTTRVSHNSYYPIFLNHCFGNMISKALGCKLPLVIQRGFPIWPNGSFPVSEPQPLAIISQQTSWPLPTIQWMIRESQKLSFFLFFLKFARIRDGNFDNFEGVNRKETFLLLDKTFCSITTIWAASISPTNLKLPICFNEFYLGCWLGINDTFPESVDSTLGN